MGAHPHTDDIILWQSNGHDDYDDYDDEDDEDAFLLSWVLGEGGTGTQMIMTVSFYDNLMIMMI